MERVSPVFDVAKQLLLVDIEKSAEIARLEKNIDEIDLLNRASHVADLGASLLICGAISRPLKLLLEAKGVDVIGQVCGSIEEILQAFLRGSLEDESFLMPGCKMRTRDFQPLSRSNGDHLGWKESRMRVAITSQGPDLTSPVDPRFGRARYLIVIDTGTGESKALDNARNLSATQGAGIQTVRDVLDEGVEAVLTGHVGPKAQEALKAARVQVFVDTSGTVRDALKQFESGQLKSSSQSVVAKPVGGSNARP
jgi:predicted Fe-Mo cluster-binding NifX family protein